MPVIMSEIVLFYYATQTPIFIKHRQSGSIWLKGLNGLPPRKSPCLGEPFGIVKVNQKDSVSHGWRQGVDP